jgi:hypothetical protein
MWTESQRWVGAFSVIALTLTAPAAHATWSIVIADSRTKEVAAGIVTCNTGGDLLPLVRVAVGKGVGICQAASDPDGLRRPIMFEGLETGTAPQNILNKLATVAEHEKRQYGIADTQGRVTTFTGTSTSAWAGGLVGSQGTMVYAIQGNVLAGGCVVPAIEQALRNTSGDIPAKLMAGMQAARLAGGDRRCSCPEKDDPADCGCPPPNFTKSGHRGGMLVARIGDRGYGGDHRSGPTDGNLFMRLSVSCRSPEEEPDPVLQLQNQFEEWRAGLVDHPDAIQSQVKFIPATVPPMGSGTARMLITLLDWRRQRVAMPIRSVTVTHAQDSAGLSTITEVSDNDDGTFIVTLTTGEGLGRDRFVVTVDDGVRPVVLTPNPSLQYVGQPEP